MEEDCTAAESRPKLTWEKVILYVDLEKTPQVYVIYHFKSSVFLKILFLFSSNEDIAMNWELVGFFWSSKVRKPCCIVIVKRNN